MCSEYCSVTCSGTGHIRQFRCKTAFLSESYAHYASLSQRKEYTRFPDLQHHLSLLIHFNLVQCLTKHLSHINHLISCLNRLPVSQPAQPSSFYCCNFYNCNFHRCIVYCSDLCCNYLYWCNTDYYNFLDAVPTLTTSTAATCISTTASIALLHLQLLLLLQHPLLQLLLP